MFLRYIGYRSSHFRTRESLYSLYISNHLGASSLGAVQEFRFHAAAPKKITCCTEAKPLAVIDAVARTRKYRGARVTMKNEHFCREVAERAKRRQESRLPCFSRKTVTGAAWASSCLVLPGFIFCTLYTFSSRAPRWRRRSLLWYGERP